MTKNRQHRRSARAFASRNWIQLPKVWLQIMPIQTAVLIAALADMAECFRRAESTWLPAGLEKDDGWFLCSNQELGRRMNYVEDHVFRCLKDLKNRGLIESVCRGVPQRRYVRVLWDVVENWTDAWESENGVCR